MYFTGIARVRQSGRATWMVTASTCIQGNSVTCVIRAGRDVSASPRILSLRAIALNWNVSQVSLSLSVYRRGDTSLWRHLSICVKICTYTVQFLYIAQNQPLSASFPSQGRENTFFWLQNTSNYCFVNLGLVTFRNLRINCAFQGRCICM